MSRRLLIAAALLLAVAVGFVIAVRSALDGETVRRAAESRVSALLGQPVRIGSIAVSAFPAPAVTGSDILVGAERDAPELTLHRIRILPRLRSLFGGPLVIREVTLDGLSARVVKGPGGSWRLPAAVPAPTTGEGSGVVVERVTLTRGRILVFDATQRDAVRQTSAIEDIAGEAVADASGLRVSGVSGKVGGAEITGDAAVNPREARLDFALPRIRSEDLAAVLALAAADPPAFVSLPQPAEASMSIRIDRAKARLSGSGSIRAPDVMVHGVRLTALEAPLATDGVELTFAPASFAIYGGTHRGRLVMNLSSPIRWSIDSEVQGIRAGEFLAAVAGRDQRIDGVASANAALQAPLGESIPAALAGRLRVNVANGVVREFPLLAAINRALRLAEGDSRDTRFERLSATLVFTRTAGYATTDDLVLQARETRVEAAGRLGFDRSLDLRGIAIISPERSSAAVRSIRELSALRNAEGSLELPLRISGSMDDPSFSIDLQAALGRGIKNELRRRWQDLLRRRDSR
jgi:uncharacterized protein involved in outer membrane biogenesis